MDSDSPDALGSAPPNRLMTLGGVKHGGSVGSLGDRASGAVGQPREHLSPESGVAGEGLVEMMNSSYKKYSMIR